MANFDMGYNSTNISVSNYIERYRRDVVRYLDDREVLGITNQLIEISDNATDETIECYHKLKEQLIAQGEISEDETPPPLEVHIKISDENVVTVSDMGRGFPCDIPLDPDTLEPTGELPKIFPAFEDDSAGGKRVHDCGGYHRKDISGMHGAGACVARACSHFFHIHTRTYSQNAKGEGSGIYYLGYEEGARDESKGGNHGLVYEGPLTYDHEIPFYKEHGVPRTGTSIEYLFHEQVLSPTDNGVPCEPYDEDTLLHRMKVSLLGVENRDSIAIILDFKGHVTRITPYDYTPEMLLRLGEDVTDDDIMEMEIESDPEQEGTLKEFYAKIYLTYDPDNYTYKDRTVVNRLLQDYSTSTKVIDDVIQRVLEEEMEPWYKENPDILRAKITSTYRYSNYFRGVTVMSLPGAAFDSQTKSRMKSKEYTEGFAKKLYEILKANVGVFDSCLEHIRQRCVTQTLAQRNIEAEKKKAAKEKKKGVVIDVKQLMKEAVDANSSMEERIRRNKEAKKEKIIPRYTSYHRNKEVCSACIFEGDSAVKDFERLLSQKEPIDMFTLTGKIPNIYDPKNKKSQIAKQLIDLIFSKDYKEYIIFTDPDPDGAHIRLQFLAFCLECRPDMLEQERVFVVRAPYGEITVPHGVTVTIHNDYNEDRIYEEGTYYVNSYNEMEQAIAQGALFVVAFKGVADVTAKIRSNITAAQLIHDPQYKIPIKAPTEELRKYLRRVLTPNDEIKKQFANQFYTERMKQCKYLNAGNKSLKVKTSRSGAIDSMLRVTEEPVIVNYKSLSYMSFAD